MNKKGVSGLQLTTGALLYFFAIIIFFFFLPANGSLNEYTPTGDTLDTSTITFNSSVTAEESVGASSVLGTAGDLLSFNIPGIPVWLFIIGVYFPLIVLGLGIYGLIRGI